MQRIYQRGGLVANSRFDPSLLKPVDEKENNFQSQLTPVDDNQQDPGSYLDNLSSADEGFFHKLPRNILIGLAKLGHSTINMPHDVAALADKRLGDLSDQMNKAFNPATVPKYKNLKMSDYVPQQQDYDFAGMLGQKGEPSLMDKLVQGGVEYLPEIAGGKGLLTAATRRLTGVHELDAVKKAAEKFGQNNFAYSPADINEAKNYMPNTEATRQLLTSSQAGEYPASFSVRSQLGKHQNDLSNSPLAAERLMAPQVKDLRRKMLDQLQDALRTQGMHTEADMLQNGIKNYGQYMRVKNAVMPVLKRLGVPMTAAAAIGYGFTKGKNLVNSP